MAEEGTDSVTVAVIEDSRPQARIVQRVVESMVGVDCLGVWPTAEEGIKKIDAFRPDVVLMDIDLPGMSGIEATTLLKRQLPGVEVIMLTIHDDVDKIFDALKAGASGYLLKDAGRGELEQAILEVRTGGAPMSAAIARRVVEAFHRPAEPEDAAFATLSKRETEILSHVAEGLSNKEIGNHLSISVETVRVHLKHVYEKLHVRSRTEAAVKYLDSIRNKPRQE